MTEKTQEQYYQGIGRRKTAIAQVRLSKDKKQEFLVNEKSLADYFQDETDQTIAQQALQKAAIEQLFSVSVKVSGGGKKAQAEAVRHGIARALITFDAELRPRLKGFGFLTRDPRMRERKKFGLQRARRARQWRKR